jgi:hypothetical protein
VLTNRAADRDLQPALQQRLGTQARGGRPVPVPLLALAGGTLVEVPLLLTYARFRARVLAAPTGDGSLLGAELIVRLQSKGCLAVSWRRSWLLRLVGAIWRRTLERVPSRYERLLRSAKWSCRPCGTRQRGEPASESRCHRELPWVLTPPGSGCRRNLIVRSRAPPATDTRLRIRDTTLRTSLTRGQRFHCHSSFVPQSFRGRGCKQQGKR